VTTPAGRIAAMSTSAGQGAGAGAAGTFTFEIHPERLAIARLPADAALPSWAQGGFVTVSRTAAELSIVCAQRHVPAAVQQERDRVAFGITGTVPMTTIGVLAALCGALAASRVPVFVISTYDTDWLLVTAADAPAAQRALDAAGHRFTGSWPA
jgi:hypothetical protein